jgi:gluconate 2-dehydrogenase subunit 3-like protein
MTGRFLSAVVDTLFPGDDGAPPLPSATAAGVAATLAEHLVGGRDAPLHEAALRAIASAADGEEEFVRADDAKRISAVRRVEAQMSGPFRGLVSCVLHDYYDAEAVLIAMGWRAEPPQPTGHVVPPLDSALLEPVKRRGRIWR